jgi:hypothetical protein
LPAEAARSYRRAWSGNVQHHVQLQPTSDAFPNDPTHGTYFFGRGDLHITRGAHQIGVPATEISADVDNNSPFGDQLAIGMNSVFTTTAVLGLVVRGVDVQGRLLQSEAFPTNIAAALNAAPRREFFVTDSAVDF